MYEDLRDLTNLKAFMETQLDDYNQSPGLVPMSLVLFKDAIQHSVFHTKHTHTVQLVLKVVQVFPLPEQQIRHVVCREFLLMSKKFVVLRSV